MAYTLLSSWKDPCDTSPKGVFLASITSRVTYIFSIVKIYGIEDLTGFLCDLGGFVLYFEFSHF